MNKSINIYLMASLAAMCSVSLVSCHDDDDDDIKQDVREYVDLGLPSGTLWATCNIGASKPEEYGSYFAWGETKPKKDYTFSNYTGDNAKFIGDNKTSLDKEDDAAAVNWQGDWVTPSIEDWEELLGDCSLEWTSDYYGDGSNIEGCFVRCSKSGNTNSIFIPASGYKRDDIVSGASLYYRTSSLGIGYSRESCSASVFFEFGNVGYGVNSYSYRCNGMPVRPVCPRNGDANGHDAVDLGLKSGKLWATCNVGSASSGEVGDYFAFGETSAKDVYSWSTYKFIQSGQSDYKYINKYQCQDCMYDCSWYQGGKYTQSSGVCKLASSDDAATANWGKGWSIPTSVEWEELLQNTTQVWTVDYNGTGVKGCVVTSSVEGYQDVAIFLPAAGYRYSQEVFNEGSWGYYWHSEKPANLDVEAYVTAEYRNSYYPINLYSSSRWERMSGLPVRPVWHAAK